MVSSQVVVVVVVVVVVCVCVGGDPVAQWVRCWPTDLVLSSSSPPPSRQKPSQL